MPEIRGGRRRVGSPKRRGRGRWALPSLAGWIALVGVVVAAGGDASTGTTSGRAAADAAGTEGGAGSLVLLLERGAEVYERHCATCHGTTGLGLAEARERFPADHAYCERCHPPRNPATMQSREIGRDQTAFSLGQPPAVADGARLARYGTAAALVAYVRSAMPRWAPGSLSDAEYVAVTLHMLERAGLLDHGDDVDIDRLDALSLAAD